MLDEPPTGPIAEANVGDGVGDVVNGDSVGH